MPPPPTAPSVTAERKFASTQRERGLPHRDHPCGSGLRRGGSPRPVTCQYKLRDVHTSYRDATVLSRPGIPDPWDTSPPPWSSPPTTSKEGWVRPRRRSTSPISPRAAARPHCCGTSTRRGRARTCSASSRRSRAVGRSSSTARATRRPGSRAPTTTGSTCCRRTSPTATWTFTSTPPSARRAGWPGCCRRSSPSTTTCSSTARRASRWCPRACSRPPTRC